MKIKNIHIDDYKVFKNFDINFLDSASEPLDLIVLAGINGSGKTTLFEFIKSNMIPIVPPNEKNEHTLNNKNGFIKIFLEKVINKRVIIPLDTPIVYFEAQEQRIHNVTHQILEYLDTLIFEKELSAKDAYKILADKISDIFDGLDMQVKFDSLDRNKQIYFTNALKEKILINDLSTGEKELLSKIFYLHISDIKDSIILIDEPEISLHPSWQNKIVKIYKNFAKQNNNQIIIATHSPQIVASTPNESLRVLVKENNGIKSYSPDAYGMQVNKALTDVMGVIELRDVEVQQQYDKVKNMILDNSYKSDAFKEELDKLEQMMLNDSVDFGLLKLEILKRETNATGN